MSSVNVLLSVNKYKTKQDHIRSSTQVYVLCLPSQYHLHISTYIIMLEHHHTGAYGLHILMLQNLIKLAEKYYLQRSRFINLFVHGTSYLLHGQVNVYF